MTTLVTGVLGCLGAWVVRDGGMSAVRGDLADRDAVTQARLDARARA